MTERRRIDFRIERPQTLREQIVDSIRDAIIHGVLKPGERVAEPELALRFGISRTPIREAFRQLESEGYLRITPRRGAVVVALTEKDVSEFYDVKAVLEGHAARRAATRLTDADLAELERLNAELARLAGEGDVHAFFDVHNAFHDVFLRAADNDRLEQMLRSLVQQFERYRLASLVQPGRMRRSVEDHARIIEAFRARDPERAEALVRGSAELGGEVLRRVVRGEGPTGGGNDGAPSAS
ncbi:MAG TPA: GntR family transcriptional regulator [Thermodesulfobacteriota bacterium]